MPWPFVPPDPDKPPASPVTAWTAQPFPELGDPPGGPAPIRKVLALQPIGADVALIRLPNGSEAKVKRTTLCKSAEACG
jgi:hypothetical protein